MLTRRQLLLCATMSAATAASCKIPAVFAAASPSKAVPANSLTALFDRFVERRLALSPESATGFGLDSGAHAAAKSRLDDRSVAGRDELRRNADQEFAEIRAFDRAKLSPADAVNYDTVVYDLEGQTQANKRFASMNSAGAPYTIYQLGGAYRDIPDFLDTQHKIENSADAESYLARLQAFAKTLDQEIETTRHDAAAGVKQPDFVLDKTRLQLRRLRDLSPEKARLVQSVVQRTGEQKIPGDWSARATAIYTKQIQPALDRQIALIESLRKNATSDAGVWKLPDGDAYYDLALKHWNTSNLTADEIHKIGLEQVAAITSAMDRDLRAQNLTTGTVAQRMSALTQDPRFILPNTDESRAKLLGDLNSLVTKVRAMLPQYFGTLPKANVEIRRVPPTIEAGQSIGYYTWPSMDGTRPGAYYLNLRDMKELPLWKLPSITYHETVPGHHLQLAMQTEASLPMIRRMSFYSAYIEGWALYAEQLADEMGVYAEDPFARIGYLSEALVRAVRLVVDTALHRKHWTREQAIRYSVETLGGAEATSATEVERYCVWPGQACAYMLGKLVWLKCRENARAKLGPKFDLRKFHDAGLLAGAVPLTVLEQIFAEAKLST
jgi:uncharacterized protein (DUF885 family)